MFTHKRKPLALFQPLLAALLWVVLPVGAAESSVDQLIEQRLQLMKGVAAYKWQRDIAVEDREREQKVVALAVRTGLEYGLTRDSVAGLLRAQIEAAKQIQHYWLDQWREGRTTPGEIPDLQEQIRPRLIDLGGRIIAAAADFRASGTVQRVGDMAVEGMGKQSRDRIVAALSEVSVYPDRLTQILDSGMLRIGTTGDYPPFTHRSEGGTRLAGIDIEQGRDLARALGVEPVFVATTWPTLMADLGDGKFDIAMGGVSRTLERQRQGFFSRPYHVGGKTAITRCDNVDRFETLDAIDRPGVRVIVNPGGTNERFVDARLRRAQKTVHADNRTIFAELASGGADVMITDRIEADWQAARKQALCTPSADNFTYQEKAYLLPREIELKEFVDTWLSLRIAEGKLDPLLSVD